MAFPVLSIFAEAAPCLALAPVLPLTGRGWSRRREFSVSTREVGEEGGNCCPWCVCSQMPVGEGSPLAIRDPGAPACGEGQELGAPAKPSTGFCPCVARMSGVKDAGGHGM